ncbi:hypothetical protein Hanom_Chr16g01484221 [Helianthus anomalus]
MVVLWWCDGDDQRSARRHCFSPVQSSVGHRHTAPQREREKERERERGRQCMAKSDNYRSPLTNLNGQVSYQDAASDSGMDHTGQNPSLMKSHTRAEGCDMEVEQTTGSSDKGSGLA